MSASNVIDLFALRSRPATAIPSLKEVSVSTMLAEIGSRIDDALTRPAAADDLKLLSAPDVAAMLAIPVAAVYVAARRKEIGSVRASVGSRSGRAVRFTRRQVADFIAARSRSAG